MGCEREKLVELGATERNPRKGDLNEENKHGEAQMFDPFKVTGQHVSHQAPFQLVLHVLF